MTDIMLVGPNHMLVGHEGRTWSQAGRRVMQNTESLYCPLGVIPNSSKLGSKADLSSGALDQGGSP